MPMIWWHLIPAAQRGAHRQEDGLALAMLSMYDPPEVHRHTDALWGAIRDALEARQIDAPNRLTRSPDAWAIWRDPALVLSQTCGYPYVAKLRGTVSIVGTPDYGCVSGMPGWYSSVIICRADDPRASLREFAGARFAYNEPGSQSGCHAMMHTLLQTIGQQRHFGPCKMTGAHAQSIKAVAEGRADIASIDIVTWNLLRAHRAIGGNLRVLMETQPTPGLPFVTALHHRASDIGDAVCEALGAVSQATRDVLQLRGFWRSTTGDYDLIAHRAAQSGPVFDSHFNAPVR